MRLYAFGQTEVQAQQIIQPGTASTETRESLHLDNELDLRCKFPLPVERIGVALLTSLIVLLSGKFKCPQILNDGNGWSRSSLVASQRLQSPGDMNAKAVQSNRHAPAQSTSGSLHGGPSLGCRDCFRFFISAVVELISFRLARDADVLPLNFRTFVNRPICSSEVANVDDMHSIATVPVQLTAIDVQLTATGKLLLSTTSRLQLSVYPAHHFTAAQETRDPLGQPVLVRIAPNGTIARLLRKTTEPGTRTVNNTKNQFWRSKVIAWLGRKGISLNGLDQDSYWESILIPVNELYLSGTVSIQNTSKEAITVEWPTSLCLRYATLPPSGLDFSPRSRDGLDQNADDACNKWFRSRTNHGFQDPIDFAFDWLMTKSKRDEEMEARRARRLEEQEIQRNDEELSFSLVDVQLSPSSLVAVFGDHQTASAMYPTPPDGLFSQKANGSSPMETDTGQAFQTHDSRQSSTGIPPHTDDLRPSETTSGAFNSMGPAYIVDHESEDNKYANNNKDFNETGITDADFNFFDQPHRAVDKKMLEADNYTPEAQQDVLQPGTRNVHMQRSQAMETDEEFQQLHHVSNIKNTDEIAQLCRPNETRPSNVYESQIKSGSVNSRSLSTPPLNPLLIKQSSIQAPGSFICSQRDVSHPHRRENNFETVAFDPKFDIADKKYRLDGRFGHTVDRHSSLPILPIEGNEVEFRPAEVPTLGWRPTKSPLRPRRDYGTSHSENHANLPLGVKSTFSHDGGHKAFNKHSSWNAGGSISSSFNVPKSKRRKPSSYTPAGLLSGSATGTTSDAGGSPKNGLEDVSLFNSPDYMILLQDSLFEPNAADWSLLDYPPPDFEDHSNDAALFPIFGGYDYIASAQLVVEQVALSTLNQITRAEFQISAKDSCFNGAIKPSNNQAVQKAILGNFPSATMLNLTGLASIQGTLPEPAAPGKLQPRPVLRRSNTPNTNSSATGFGAEPTFAIQTPLVRLQKTDAMWDMMPTAIPFWETLGLGPASGPKNILAWCIYPFSEGLESHIVRFLDTIENTYQSFKLGNHARGEDTSDFQNGLVPVRVATRASVKHIMEGIREMSTRLGSSTQAFVWACY